MQHFNSQKRIHISFCDTVPLMFIVLGEGSALLSGWVSLLNDPQKYSYSTVDDHLIGDSNWGPHNKEKSTVAICFMYVRIWPAD